MFFENKRRAIFSTKIIFRASAIRSNENSGMAALPTQLCCVDPGYGAAPRQASAGTTAPCLLNKRSPVNARNYAAAFYYFMQLKF